MTNGVMYSRFGRFVPTLLVIALLGVSWEGYRARLRRQEEESSQAALRKLRQDELSLQHVQTSLLRELALARQELAATEARSREIGSSPEATMRKWWSTIVRIRDLFAQHPDQSIPELQLLEPFHWIKLAVETKLDDEEGIRKIFAAVRALAKVQVMQKVNFALHFYTETHDGQLPTSMEQLASPYAGRPEVAYPPLADPDISARYRIMASGKISDLPKQAYVFAENAPIDSKYDQRLTIGVTQSSLFGWSTSEMDDAYQQAAIDYMKANGGKESANQDELVPYIQSPAMKAVIQAQQDYARSHGGRQTTDPTELRPYLHTSEAQTLAEKLWPRER